MSSNNKSARLHREARDWSSRRKGGGKGPASTMPKHGKKKAWFQLGNKRVVKQGAGGETIAIAIRTETSEQRLAQAVVEVVKDLVIAKAKQTLRKHASA